MSSSQQSYYDDILDLAVEVHNKEANSLGLSPEKYTIAKNIRLLLSEHKATLPFYYAAMMQKEVDNLFEKEVECGQD